MVVPVKLKIYSAHVTLVRKDCPHTYDEIDVMDNYEKHDVYEDYMIVKHLKFKCEKGGRDEAMAVGVRILLHSNPDYEVFSQTVPAFDGYDGDEE
jgi:hypothetical protein